MIETICLVFHYMNDALRIINPFLFFGATCLWIVLKNRTDKELSRMYLRCYAMEKQIDFLVNNRDVDRDYFDYMKKTYQDMQDKIL